VLSWFDSCHDYAVGDCQYLGAVNVELGAMDNDAGAAILRRRFKRKTCTEEGIESPTSFEIELTIL
jgi:hypothetical protein